MKKGDLIKFNESNLTAIIVSGPYNKPIWGDSGHPEDIEIASIVEIVRTGNGWGSRTGQKRGYRLRRLRRLAKVISTNTDVRAN